MAQSFPKCDRSNSICTIKNPLPNGKKYIIIGSIEISSGKSVTILTVWLEEQLELIQRVAEGLKQSAIATKPKTRWSDLKGLAPYPMMGEDAQAWVSRTRREADDCREQVLREE